MSDDIDKTQDRLDLEQEIFTKYRKEPASIKGNGYCLNCGEPLRKNGRWCDQYCRDDYEFRTK